MNKEELGKLYPITIVNYDCRWTSAFETEKQTLRNILGSAVALRIEHIGSTAVSNLSAKPTIDILVEIPKKDEVTYLVIDYLEKNDYIHMKGQKNHLMFVKGYSPNGLEKISFHIHLGTKEQDFLWDRLYFRDYLRNNPLVAKEYESLKLKLAKVHQYDREAYTNEKTDFIRKITMY
ncbi:GrpB family protein [Bacillus aquiflavi]|uniref:GrpB family protein n=1 Tax=Bacillus aquiflavi TaxID=2672567 RepID=A0A6B3W1Y5_9BACI|nr:GrpB family protein [Bacillus aquiflavi]MBA4537140.1 GrpB family protein [Bacillus aquiflavi]NEY82725.1 GrpB family protein [Bacillus aquiflavi]UAC49766.1 GrpB family protein [Bacillus aquiflavi]